MLRPQPAPFSEFDSPSRSSRTSASRNRRCPPGVRMLLIRPDAAHRVTVFGSTLKSAATSPGVSRRSLLPSIAPTPWVRGLSPSVAETRELSHKQQLYPSIRKIPYAEVFVALLHTARQGRPCACACPHTARQGRPCACACPHTARQGRPCAQRLPAHGMSEPSLRRAYPHTHAGGRGARRHRWDRCSRL